MNSYHKIKDFDAERLRGVGSSEIPILAGMTKKYFQDYLWVKTGQIESLNQTVRTLWLVKAGRVVQVRDPKKDKRKMWGNHLEPLILREFIGPRYGDEVAHEFYRNATRAEPVSSGPFKTKVGAFHPQYKFAMAHTDLLIDGELDGVALPQLIVEAKSSGFMAGKRREGAVFDGYDEDDLSQFGIPDKVFMQWQWQAFCFGVEEGYVCPLIDTADYREYGPIIYDPRHVEKSLALAERFWWHVEHDKEPAPQTWGDVLSVYPDLENKTAMVSGEAEMEARRMIARGADLKARKKAIEEELEDVKAGLGILAGDQRTEDGKLVRSMNTVLAASDGEPLAKFRDQTKDTLTLTTWLDSAKAKEKKLAAAKKKWEADKLKLSEYQPIVDECHLTEYEVHALKLDAELRALGAYKTSEPFRVVTY